MLFNRWVWRALMVAIPAVIVVDVTLIIVKHLALPQGVDLVAASFVALSGVSAAVAAYGSLTVSWEVKEANDRATQALSRAVLPDRVGIVLMAQPATTPEVLLFNVQSGGEDGRPRIIIAAAHRMPGGDASRRVALRGDGGSPMPSYYIEGLPPKAPLEHVRSWGKIVVTFTDKASVAKWEMIVDPLEFWTEGGLEEANPLSGRPYDLAAGDIKRVG